MLIGREKEKEMLLNSVKSEQSEFVAVYGRRRVGKTYLIRETFNYEFAFQHTGILDAPMKIHLTLITSFGVTPGSDTHSIHSMLDMDDLFN